ncbi:hypothetical protein GOP47_0016201 [Adiantum capillus-veneris]|uniref:Uncharacterized protein n=1 Tax=Adiantum capillus-veneris TaxID=13818 RepID=A0A9D4ZCQ9_ADICA|nr:hypothetical protein GOP47_0016201 [Adiantum capillus-veneris]
MVIFPFLPLPLKSFWKVTRTSDHLEEGQETPISRVDDVHFFLVANLYTIYNMVESKHPLALLECNEATRKLGLHNGNVHQDEGANLLVDKLTGQLKDAKVAIQKTQDNMDIVDVVYVEKTKNTIVRLSLTIQTLQGIIVEKESIVGDMARAQDKRDLIEEMDECV